NQTYGSDEMKYKEVMVGKFFKRVNRFIAEVYIHGVKERVHIKNTGRLEQLLKCGVEVILEKSNQINRKTKYSIIAVKKNGQYINIDSQAPNKVVYEALEANRCLGFGKVKSFKTEVTYGRSRFDFYFETAESKGFIEVKGVTFEKDGVAMFPDAPTSRGTKHILDLIDASRLVYSPVILFVIKKKRCNKYTPDLIIDHMFSMSLNQAFKSGVRMFAFNTIVKKNSLVLYTKVPIKL